MLLIKPTGSDCNLNCTYCFYKDRAPEIGCGKQRMSDKVLERLIQTYIKLNFPLLTFSWQGGEPTLMGLNFYRKVIELQQRNLSPNQQVYNSLQTNAVLLDEKWCQFLHDNNFLVGISIDGPEKFHDYYRVDRSGYGTFERVSQAIEKCKKYRVEFNILCLLNDLNVKYPDELFDFFVGRGIKYLQFVPCLEPGTSGSKYADFSINPQQYGNFLCRLFDRWYNYGPQKLSIRDFDSILLFCINGEQSVCTFGRQCDSYVVIEYNGDVFCCDFFVESKWRLGNIFETKIDKLANSPKKKTFAKAKLNFPDKCLSCKWIDVCCGGCIKHRNTLYDQHKEPNFFCKSYKLFFDHTMPRFMQIAADIKAKLIPRDYI